MRKSRRKLLVGVSASVTFLAGCTSSGNNTNGDNSSDSSEGESSESNVNVFDDIDIGTMDLTFSLSDGADVDGVRLLNPDESERSYTSIGTGISSGSLEFVDEYADKPYEAGETYTLIAIRDESVVTEYTISIAPKLEATLTNQNKEKAAIELNNIGTGPAFIHYVEAKGGLNETSINSEVSSFTEKDIVPAGEAKIFESNDDAFVYSNREDEMCTGTGQDDLDLTIRVNEATSGGMLISTDTISVRLIGDNVSAGFVNSQHCTELDIEDSTVSFEQAE